MCLRGATDPLLDPLGAALADASPLRGALAPRSGLASPRAAYGHHALEWPDDVSYRADLDAVAALCKGKLIPELFPEHRDMPYQMVRGYAYVLLIGYRLGLFLGQYPLDGPGREPACPLS